MIIRTKRPPAYSTISILIVFWLGLPSAILAQNADDTDPRPVRWWKGNIHTHSLWSDGDDFPEMIADWYQSHGYNFLALSDHNVFSEGMRWMKASAIEGRGGKECLQKYRLRFGADWVETSGDPDSADYAIRLKPLDEFRHLVEEHDRFIMVHGEEISDSAEGGPIHMNATNLSELIEPQGGATVRDTIRNNLRAVLEQAKRTGRDVIAHLNHPNFGYAVTAEDIAAVIEEKFFEVYNGHPAVGHLGDENHPSIERMWDIANTLRIGELNSAPIYGVATDDSHNYHGKPGGSYTGRGWIMVRSKYLTPEHLIRAMNAGDFYASSGVTLSQVYFDAKSKTLEIEVEPVANETYTIEFIGTRKGYDPNSQPREGDPRVTRKYSSDIGATLATVNGHIATYRFKGDELYVRAVVTSSAKHSSPSFEGQKKQAWTQPVTQ